PEIGAGLGDYAIQRLRRRDIEVHLQTRLESASGGRMVLSSGESFEADTLVWTTGVRAHPALARMGLPLDERGRVIADEFLGVRLRGFPAWFLHRTYHLSRLPTANRKVRVMLDWTVALFFRRDVAQLGSLQHPREPLREATGG